MPTYSFPFETTPDDGAVVSQKYIRDGIVLTDDTVKKGCATLRINERDIDAFSQ